MQQRMVSKIVLWEVFGLPVVGLMGCPEGDNPDHSTDYADSTDSHSSDDAGQDDTGQTETGFAMHVVDVGSGVGIFVEGPGFTLVYDAGSDDDTALGDGNRFTAYIRAVRPGLQRIDHVILSHPHNDHMTLLSDVFADYEIGDVWDSGATSSECAYQAFLMATEEKGAVYHSAVNDPAIRDIPIPEPCDTYPSEVTLEHGTRIEAGLKVSLGNDADMVFLYANGQTLEGQDDNYPNYNSLVVRLDLGDKRFLLMGDGHAGKMRDPSEPPDEGSVEAKLLEDPSELDADALVVGYHGWSAGSRSVFVEAVSPEVSIIPSYPLYAGPEAVVVTELEAYGPVFQTDVDDIACAQDPAKIGTDADGKRGGCSNVKVSIDDTGKVVSEYLKFAD